jgi:hypothetical protein
MAFLFMALILRKILSGSFAPFHRVAFHQGRAVRCSQRQYRTSEEEPIIFLASAGQGLIGTCVCVEMAAKTPYSAQIPGALFIIGIKPSIVTELPAIAHSAGLDP